MHGPEKDYSLTILKKAKDYKTLKRLEGFYHAERRITASRFSRKLKTTTLLSFLENREAVIYNTFEKALENEEVEELDEDEAEKGGLEADYEDEDEERVDDDIEDFGQDEMDTSSEESSDEEDV